MLHLHNADRTADGPPSPFWSRRLLAFLGPGYLVSVGYMDPGNWATDLAGGSKFGYTLLSVILLSNLMAILLQALAARLGIVTDRDLAQACRASFSRPVNFMLWLACEAAIIACDLAEVIGTAPIERLDVLHGVNVVQTARPFTAADLGRRVRVTWQGAEYRGRGRETMWQGKLTLAGNRFARFTAVNFLNPERKVEETSAGTALTWTSVTTGNLAGIDIWLDEARRGSLTLDTNVVSGEVDLTTLADDTVAFDGGGLGRRISVYRLPEQDWSR